jgi:pyridinium-3,5-bisthiocarboxylic acid mononucleotide nickel chelatase
MLIMVNVDNIAGEVVPYIVEGLLANGAQNVHVVQAITKKGRWEFLFYVDVPEEKIEPVGDYLVSELGTIGFRVLETRHVKFEYETIQLQLVACDKNTGQELLHKPIRVKLIQNSHGAVASVKAEYEDVRACAVQLQQMGLDISFTALKEMIERSALGEKHENCKQLRVEL